MPVRIFNNIPSLNAQRILGLNNDRLSTSVEELPMMPRAWQFPKPCDPIFVPFGRPFETQTTEFPSSTLQKVRSTSSPASLSG